MSWEVCLEWVSRRASVLVIGHLSATACCDIEGVHGQVCLSLMNALSNTF